MKNDNINNNSNESDSNIRNSTKDNSNISNKGNTLLYPSEVSLLLNVSLQTLRRWYKEKKLLAVMTPGGQLRIPQSEVTRLLGRYAPVEDYDPRKDPNAIIVTRDDLQDDGDNDFIVPISPKAPDFKQMILKDKQKKQEQELAAQLGLEYIETKAK